MLKLNINAGAKIWIVKGWRTSRMSTLIDQSMDRLIGRRTIDVNLGRVCHDQVEYILSKNGTKMELED